MEVLMRGLQGFRPLLNLVQLLSFTHYQGNLLFIDLLFIKDKIAKYRCPQQKLHVHVFET